MLALGVLRRAAVVARQDLVDADPAPILPRARGRDERQEACQGQGRGPRPGLSRGPLHHRSLRSIHAIHELNHSCERPDQEDAAQMRLETSCLWTPGACSRSGRDYTLPGGNCKRSPGALQALYGDLTSRRDGLASRGRDSVAPGEGAQHRMGLCRYRVEHLPVVKPRRRPWTRFRGQTPPL